MEVFKMQKYEGIRIIPTYYCNKNCSFCYQPTKKCGFMNTNQIHEKVLNDIDFIPAYITFMGGELSCFPEESKTLMSIIHSKFPMVYAKSLITNGNGDLNWYKSLKNEGITKIIFSCHSPEDINIMLPKIETISKSAFFTARVNCFLNKQNISLVKNVVEICQEKDFPLTLCYDIKCSADDRIIYDDMETMTSYLSPGRLSEIRDNFTIVHCKNNYQYWIYYHKENVKNNLIILPDCSTTDDFTDVENCKGVV